jgi:uncharacterized protein YjbI with pentapeptide repeats
MFNKSSITDISSVISENSMENLPRMAQLIFGSRCVRRLLPLASYGSEVLFHCDNVTSLVEELASIADLNDKEYIMTAHLLSDEWRILQNIRLSKIKLSEAEFLGNSAVLLATSALVEACLDDAKDQYLSAKSHLKILSVASITLAALISYSKFNDISLFIGQIEKDFEILIKQSRENLWNDDNPVPAYLMSLYLEFDLKHKHNGFSILDLGSLIYEKLLILLKHDRNNVNLCGEILYSKVNSILDEFGLISNILVETKKPEGSIIAIETDQLENKFLLYCAANNNSIHLSFVEKLNGPIATKEDLSKLSASVVHYDDDDVPREGNTLFKMEPFSFAKIVEWIGYLDKLQLAKTVDPNHYLLKLNKHKEENTYVNILKKGVHFWNQWISANQALIPDLRGVNLSGEDLRGADFTRANLRDAKLDGANLSKVNFTRANCTNVDFRNAIFEETLLTDTNLKNAKNLDNCIHKSGSYIDIKTILKSLPISFVFLKGVGLDDSYIKTILESHINPSGYHNCFISYSHKDKEFVSKLYKDLTEKGITCWLDEKDLRIGDKIRQKLDDSIHKQDKFIIVISNYSIKSPWVEKEVETAFEKEYRTGNLVLLPICIDSEVWTTKISWVSDIRRMRLIGDFTAWGDSTSYKDSMDRLLSAIKVS